MNKKRFFERMVRIEQKLRLENPEIFEEQKHLDKGIESVYWNYGYLMAMKDVVRNFIKEL